MNHLSTLPAAADARRAAIPSDMEAQAQGPKGPYCYTRSEAGVQACPFWASDPTKPVQDNGYCALTREGDWQSVGMALLWDMVKECGINPDDADTQSQGEVSAP